MRGKIIQYNGADGNGTLVVEGRQHRFALDAWHADSAPTVNKVVEVSLENDIVTELIAVGDDVLLKEKAAQLGGKLGSLLNKVPVVMPSSGTAPNSAATGGITATPRSEGAAASVIDRYGKSILGAYMLFLLGTLGLNAISLSMMGQGIGKSLFDIASLTSQFGHGGSGGIKLALLLAYASIVAPMFWRDRRAWLALLLPLIAVLWAIFSALHTLGSVGGELGRDLSDMFSIDFGFYLSLTAALVLAGAAIKRSLSST